MARHFRGTGHTLRFIEYMDVGTTNGWRLDDVVPAAEIVAHDRRRVPARAASTPRYRGEVASAGATATARGEIGVIASVTQPFCGDCTRARHLGRRQALHVPLRRRAATTCARSLRVGRDRRRAREAIARGLGARAPTATPSSAPSGRASLRKVEMSYIGG